MDTIKKSVLAAIQSINGVSFANIDMVTTLTSSDMTGGKKNPMLGRVKKVVIGMPVMLGRSSEDGSSLYENSVNRKHEKAGLPTNFKSGGLKDWAEIVDWPIFKHKEKGTHYIQCLTGIPTTVFYVIDDMQMILPEQIIGLKKKAKTSDLPKAIVEAIANGELDIEPRKTDSEETIAEKRALAKSLYLPVRTPKLENITRLAIMGNVETSLVDDTPTLQKAVAQCYLEPTLERLASITAQFEPADTGT